MSWLKSSEDPNQNPADMIAMIVEKHPIELEERINTLDRPLVLECACPGWQPKMWPPPGNYPWRKPVNYEEGGVRYPAIPCSLEDQTRELLDAVRAGCQVVHVHPRDPEDCMASVDLPLLQAVYDPMLEQLDAITIQHTWKITADGTMDFVSDAEAMLAAAGGNRYCQGAVVLWPPQDSYPPRYTQSVHRGIAFMEEHSITPVHKLRSTYHVRQLHRTLVDTGVQTTRPMVLVHDMGHPFGWPLDIDPWMPVDLITSIVQTKERIPESVIFSGGRNWLPITMTAILAGVDFVRVGIEDCYWMYPHKDEVIQSNAATVKKIVDFCGLIGRRIATVDEARRILGVRRTS